MSTPEHQIAPARLTLDEVVAWHADRHPERPCLEFSHGPPISWGWFGRAVQGTADALPARFKPKDVVAVLCDDTLGFHVLVNALWRRGVTVLLLSRTWGRAVVGDLLALTGAVAVFCGAPENLSALPGNVLPFPCVELSDSPARGSAASCDDVAIIASTSGTTDNPKCVPILHREIRSAYRAALMTHDFGRVRRAASLFPLNGIGVMGVCFLFPREIGAATRTYPPFSIANVRESWSSVLSGGADFVYLVPPLVRLLATLPKLERAGEPVLCFCASAPVTEGELRKLEARFPVRVFNAYGLTEMTFAVFFGCRDDDGAASESIGYPLGVQARLVDEAGEVLNGAGQGELQLRGPMLTSGYLYNAEATRATRSNDWLCTGDLAARDASGRYYIRGRIRDSVIRGGVLTHLHELEHYLRRSPDVVDAVAFKGRDLPSGDELCAVVQAREAIPPRDLMTWVGEHVGRDKVPNALFVWTQELPRNSNGKVERRVLAELYKTGALR